MVSWDFSDTYRSCFQTASIFWGTFTAGRFLAVALAMRFTPQQLLCCSCAVAAACIVVFTIFTDNLFVVQLISGVCMATAIPPPPTSPGIDLTRTWL